ncbi:MAG: GvpL/GvpF family gas vesicle protein [Acidobacteria bacterium]|nr:GvpL/GvpF family gas vesicle protein [Acidobacteriota bacterium]
MSIYAYCLLRLPLEETWPILIGVGQHPVFPFRAGKYAMLLSRLERNFPFTPRSIVEHAQIVARTFETHTVLPMRFGTFFNSEKQIEQLIRENREELLETFCRLRGKAEMRMKVTVSPVSSVDQAVRKPPRKSGFSADDIPEGVDLPVDAATREFAAQITSLMREIFHPAAEQVSCRRLHTGELVVDCAHLVDMQRVAGYQRLLPLAEEHIKECTLRMTGPWPPYHFLPSAIRLPSYPLRPLTRKAAVVMR